MRIGIDNISPGESTNQQGPGGMRMYLQSLLTEFASSAPCHQFVLFSAAWSDPLLDKLPPNLEVVNLPAVPVNRSFRILYQQTALAAVIARQQLDAFLATATVAPLLCTVPVILAVQFLQFYQWPEAYGRFRTAYLKVMLPLSLKKARRAIIFTESAKKDLVLWTGVPAEKVNVVPHGLFPDIWRLAGLPVDAPEYRVGLTLTGQQPYILYISATYGYKNHAGLIKALGILKRRKNIPHVLLLVGSQVTISYDELRAVAEQEGVAEDVVFAGRLEPNELALATYLSADVTVISTLYETFGYPILEAMACGCPVVTSNCGAMAELAGNAAVLVNPLDPNDIANGIERVLSDKVLRQNLITMGRERAKSYTMEKSAALTLQIIEEVARAKKCEF